MSALSEATAKRRELIAELRADLDGAEDQVGSVANLLREDRDELAEYLTDALIDGEWVTDKPAELPKLLATLRLSEEPVRVQGYELRSKVLSEIAAERERQIFKGYTAAHDDEEGLSHLLDETVERLRRTKATPGSRGAILSAAAILVAAIEGIDRN